MSSNIIRKFIIFIYVISKLIWDVHSLRKKCIERLFTSVERTMNKTVFTELFYHIIESNDKKHMFRQHFNQICYRSGYVLCGRNKIGSWNRKWMGRMGLFTEDLSNIAFSWNLNDETRISPENTKGRHSSSEQ